MARAAEFPNEKSDSEWRVELTSKEFDMLRNRGTEAPGTGEFFSFFPKEGYFGCRACKHPLYSSTSKFKDCGWDAFDKCFFSNGKCHVGVRPDFGGLEIICNACNSHLGHVFYGERHTDTDERHWVNSICIKYFKDAELPAGLTEGKVEIDQATKSAMHGKCAQQ